MGRKFKSYTINNFMNLGAFPNPYKKHSFDKQKNFSYFKFDDFWGLKNKNPPVYNFDQLKVPKENSFFDFSNGKHFQSLE